MGSSIHCEQEIIEDECEAVHNQILILSQLYVNEMEEMGEEEEEEWEMVQKKGNQFVVNDEPFYVNGFNTYWLMVFAADESTRGKVSEVFKLAALVNPHQFLMKKSSRPWTL